MQGNIHDIIIEGVSDYWNLIKILPVYTTMCKGRFFLVVKNNELPSAQCSHQISFDQLNNSLISELRMSLTFSNILAGTFEQKMEVLNEGKICADNRIVMDKNMKECAKTTIDAQDIKALQDTI